MNTAPRPGQPGQGAAQPGAAQAGQQRIQLFRPETIEKITWLSPEDKGRYTQGLRQLWNNLESQAKDSPEYTAIQQRIAKVSHSLIQKNAQIAQQRRQQQAQQAQQSQQTNATAPNANTNGPAAAVAGPAAPGVVAAAGNTAGTVAAAAAAPAAAAPAGGNAAAASQRAQQQQQQQQQQPQPQPQPMPDHIRKHLNEIRFQAPPQVIAKGEAETKRTLDALKKAYASALVRMDAARQGMNRIDATIKERDNSGSPFNPEERRQFQTRRDAEQKKHDESHKVVEQIRRQQDQISKQRVQNGGVAASQPSQGGAAATPVPVPVPATAGPGGAASQGPKHGQAPAGAVNAVAAGEAAKSQGPAAAGPRSAQNNMNAGGRQVPGQGSTGAGATNATTATAQTQPRVTKIEPPHPPPVNTQIASAPHPASGTPTQNSARVQTPATATATAFPNSAAPATPAGQPRHSFTSAISMASQTQSNTGSTGTPNQAPNTTPSSNPGVISAASQPGHPHAHPSQNPVTSIPPKMPIPKNLPESAQRPPLPVSVTNQSRPTLSGGTGTPAGALGQPANPRIPTYQHQDEGEHVLSKKRLDDLVRQVCGGTAEGQPAHLLTPEVEENILLLVDNMVDNTLNIASRFAKERGSKILEIRDIQLVLERVYNIRVPGYSSDELRTVRRVQPNSAWISKMSAVQASKVMPGKGD